MIRIEFVERGALIWVGFCELFSLIYVSVWTRDVGWRKAAGYAKGGHLFFERYRTVTSNPVY